MQDRDGGRLALAEFRRHVKFPRVIWADQAYAALVDWALIKWLWLVELVRRPQGRFELQPKRWIVERTFGLAQSITSLGQIIRAHARKRRSVRANRHDPPDGQKTRMRGLLDRL